MAPVLSGWNGANTSTMLYEAITTKAAQVKILAFLCNFIKTFTFLSKIPWPAKLNKGSFTHDVSHQGGGEESANFRFFSDKGGRGGKAISDFFLTRGEGG